MKYPLTLAAITVVVLGATVILAAPEEGGTAAMKVVSGGSLTWNDLEVPGFDPGAKLAAIVGNPEEEGSLYTLRLSMPDGYRFPAHWHPKDEHVTVLSGALTLAMGDQVDDSKLEAYGVGDYLYLPAEHPHFGGAKGLTVIQLHGEGPFAINVVAAPTD